MFALVIWCKPCMYIVPRVHGRLSLSKSGMGHHRSHMLILPTIVLQHARNDSGGTPVTGSKCTAAKLHPSQPCINFGSNGPTASPLLNHALFP